MRLVIDTNVVVAGLLWTGSPRLLIELAKSGEVALFTSSVLLDELARILTRKKFEHRITATGVSHEDLVLGYADLAHVVAPALIGRVVPRDIDDDAVIACAVSAQADLVVSGDRHLLEVKGYQGISIVTVTEALRRLAQR